ncbi:sulfate permease family domain-containing protein [Phthorimaea operculella]|nr:sulfate permease family domain-containing protein [Phthorimaea operculella]
MVQIIGEQISLRRRTKRAVKNTFSVKTARRRFPVLSWLPNYNTTFLIQDIIAGLTVGLTAIPQGIAYAVVAGLSPEYGLYSGIMGGFVYMIFGSCSYVTVGPTAIMAALTAKLIAGFTPEFAILATFLSGVVILLLGILHLGFLVEFISQPVITGFTTAAALQIATSQLKSLLGLSGDAGHIFIESVTNFVKNFMTIQLWDTVLGMCTIVLLLLMKKLGQGVRKSDGAFATFKWFIALARNAVVVFIGILIGYILKLTLNSEPITLTGEIGSGLPSFKFPPTSVVMGNETLSFMDMVSALGPGSIVLPLVAILESVAIAKAFAGSNPVDATQEMIALGFCNIFGSMVSSIPITGSFTRSAINHASGVQTAAGGVVTSLLIILALSLLTSTFYYIPKPTLAGLIIAAMFSMIEYKFAIRLWKTSKKELLIFLVTIAVCLYSGLEFGIVSGIVFDAILLLFVVAKPTVEGDLIKNTKGDLMIIPLMDAISYCAADHVRRSILTASEHVPVNTVLMIDGTNLKHMDTTVASNLMSVIEDVERNNVKIQFLNFRPNLKEICVHILPKASEKFVNAVNPADLISPKAKRISMQLTLF